MSLKVGSSLYSYSVVEKQSSDPSMHELHDFMTDVTYLIVCDVGVTVVKL